VKIDSLKISNFRGITDVGLEKLGNMVIIAGQNGSGKSCLFDAIRLVKSVYGGYQHNEWQQWMGEFQINLNNRESLAALMNDPLQELRVTCEFRLAQDEREYITSKADELLRENIWRILLPEAYSWGGYRMAMFASQFRDREPEVAARAKKGLPILMQELSRPTLLAQVTVKGGALELIPSNALSIIFSTYRPQQIGVIDFHGAQRHYGREQVQGINLSLDASEQQRSQMALYNYANKYQNVKGKWPLRT
jgi:hypothetical protein